MKEQIQEELNHILAYWLKCTQDEERGGFHGQVFNDNTVNYAAPKGLVLHARILWTFSAAYRQNPQPAYLQAAERCFSYLQQHFTDTRYGGMYWSVSSHGEVLDAKKQAYALAFAVYGYVQYHQATGNEQAKQLAIDLFNDIETHFYDDTYGGYIEAVQQNWTPLQDLRLSDKDANEPKSMNTHLHILEAYTSLFQIWPDERLRTQLEKLLQVFNEYILDARTGHLQLFFGMDWSVRSQLISFGHDIEAAWLLLEAAEALGNSTWIGEMRENAVRMAAAASRGLDADGGLWYEYNLGTHHLIAEKHWWPQAEALVGFYNAWQISGDETWLKKLNATWSFIQQKLKDHKQGEWYWGIDQHDAVLSNEDKAGFWKCPYHNGRACLELINRLEQQA